MGSAAFFRTADADFPTQGQAAFNHQIFHCILAFARTPRIQSELSPEKGLTLSGALSKTPIRMAEVAQLAEHLVVAQGAESSSLFFRPIQKQALFAGLFFAPLAHAFRDPLRSTVQNSRASPTGQ